MNDAPLTLPSGTVVRQRNIVVFRGRHAGHVRIVIETPTPAAESDHVGRDAHAVAVLHDTLASAHDIGCVIVDVCRTQACLELREPPLESFSFVRGPDGNWLTTSSLDK
ncbi:MAG TPA: hypothetical protein VGM67_18665 [Gemmatimonadaceae bacterium]|jgi:hypothetical protein